MTSISKQKKLLVFQKLLKSIFKMITFNKPFLTGKELDYIKEAVNSGKISGNGMFTKKCQNFFENRFGFKKALLTTSCTDALEMCAMLANIKPGDEVIVPSYTFVSTALAFVRQGAKIIYADSRNDHPGMDEDTIETLITKKTKAIVPVHYAGVACDMDKIMAIADKYNLLVIEDAAQAIDSYYKGRPLGSIGHLAAFSFHETKNINSGEGGLLAINDDKFVNRAEIIWEKGTNRSEFFRGEVNKYGWIDVGSSFLPSEIIAAFLWAQLENLTTIQNRRIKIWETYYNGLGNWTQQNHVQLPTVPKYATNNAHMFYLVFKSGEQRTIFIETLKKEGVSSVFHYLSLHKSSFYKDQTEEFICLNSDRYTDCLVRLPFYYELTEDQQELVIDIIKKTKLL
jgi:dTDP-4-amino-4,6-dideoxygalactose transaminase